MSGSNKTKMAMCSACKQSLLVAQKRIKCTKCTLVYHLECLNIKNDNTNFRSTWLCPECIASTPKGDNSETPLRLKSQQKDNTQSDSPTETSNNMTEQVLSSSEIYNLLRDIKSELNLFRSDNRKQIDNFKTEIISLIEEKNKEYDNKIGKLTATVDKCMQDITNINKSYTDLQESYSFLFKQHDETIDKLNSAQKDIKSLNGEIKTLRNSIKNTDELSPRINYLEQQYRAKNIEIYGIPENRSEDLQQTVLTLANEIGLSINKEAILYAVRVHSKNNNKNLPKPIVVKLNSILIRDQFLSAIKRKKGITSADLGFKDRATQVYINEHLTSANKQLFNAARTCCKESGFRYVWVRNGRIFVRKSEGSQVIIIKTVSDLRRIANHQGSQSSL